MPNNSVILVVAAHPDDEVLGCGGTMAKHADGGDDVHILFLSGGIGARGENLVVRRDEQARRRQAAEAAAKIAGAHPPQFADYSDNQMDGVPLLEIIQTIETVVSEITPQIVYTHHGGDLNIDHQRTHEATLTACRPLPGSSVAQINAFEILSSTEWAAPAPGRHFVPNRFVDITAQLDRKRRALACYGEEIPPPPHARSLEAVEAQARLRGASVGVPHAEAFARLRDIWHA